MDESESEQVQKPITIAEIRELLDAFVPYDKE